MKNAGNASSDPAVSVFRASVLEGRPMARQLQTEEPSSASSRSRWIRKALAYVPHVARRFSGCGLPFDELLSAGNLGLVEASLRYQPSRKVKFVTYADWWIRKSILKALEEQSGAVRIPRYRQEQLRHLNEARRAWRRRHLRDPTADELAAETGRSRADVARLLRIGQSPISIEESSLPGGTRPLRDALVASDMPGPQDAAIRRDLGRHLHGLMGALNAKQLEVLLLRFGFNGQEPMTLRQIGRRLGISRERVRQLERRALIELRNSLASEPE